MNRPGLSALKRSLTAQISLSIAAVSILLVGGCGVLLNSLAVRELREGNELILFSNLALLREDLNAAGFDRTRDPQRLVARMDLQLGQMHLALLDEQRRIVAASDRFEVPLTALPASPMPADLLPIGIDHADIRAMGKALGPLTSVWTAPDGRSFRLLLARVPLRSDTGFAAPGYLVALAYELTQTRQLLVRETEIFVITFLVGALAATLIGVLIARRIVAGPMRLAAAANRISARPMSERLSVENTPTELVESTLAFNRMLDRLGAAFMRLSEFSSDLAHDLRTPINNLLGEAQVALSKPRTAAEYRAVLESAVEDYERISRLIENMLFLARADDPHAATHKAWIDLLPTLERGRGYFEMLAEELGIGLEIQMQGPEPAWQRIWADETLLMRAVGNLVANALRYAPRDTDVLITSNVHDGGACTIEVINEGPSIPDELQERIFDRSFRDDASRAGSASGSGLGLAIVRSIMDLHSGTARVISGPGRPTVFRLWFPGPKPAGEFTTIETDMGAPSAESRRDDPHSNPREATA